MKKKLIVFLMFAILFTQPAFAATPDEATWNALNDNNLEYNEIDDLIHYFNPSIKQMWINADEEMQDVRDSKELINDAIEELEDIYDDTTDAMMKQMLKQNINALKATRSQISKAINSLDKDTGSLNKKFRRIEGNVANPARQIMLGYKQIVIQKEMLNKLVTLNNEKYNAALTGVAAGTSTQNDVTQALADLQSAQANVSSINASENKLYNQLKCMCGWSIDGTPVIGEIPAADLSKIATYNPEADLVYAAGNTKAVTAERTGNSYAKANEQALTDQVRAQLNTLYANVLAAKQGYDAAAIGYQAAQMSWNAAQVQYAKGMISKLQYIGMQISFVQKEAEYKLANIGLVQAMLNYETAVEYGVSL